MLRNQKIQTIGNAIEDYLKENQIDKKICEYHIKCDWEKIAGKNISIYTNFLYIKEKVLYVKMASPTAKNELQMIRGQILELINQKYMKGLLTQIVVF